MKRVLIIIAITISAFITPKAICQNHITVGTTNYISTPVWNFETPEFSNANVCVGKRDQGGIVMLTQNGPGVNCYIQGSIFIYLEDMTIIKCVDKGLRSNLDMNATSIYFLTLNEINSMKKSNIKKIIFTLNFGGTMMNFTMENRHTIQVPIRYETIPDNIYPQPVNSGYETVSNDTSKDIIILFGNN